MSCVAGLEACKRAVRDSLYGRFPVRAGEKRRSTRCTKAEMTSFIYLTFISVRVAMLDHDGS